VLEGTVGYVDTWSRRHLFDELSGQRQTGAITDEAWQRALHRAADGAASVHLGCASAEVTASKADAVDVRVRDCAYPAGASSSVKTVATAQGCLVIAVPTGPAAAFVQQQANAGVSPPPTFVGSPAMATPGTWYVGPCS
jgi:hypothetical protein